MKPETRTVTQLFELDVRYVVPLYQRPYVWNESKQWEPLWEDISVLLDHQLNGTLAGQNTFWSHFLGAIVLDQETQAPGSIPVYTVIDGQQRLTTLQILLAAAANVAAANGAENDAAVLLSLIKNKPLKVSGEHLWKVWPTNVNRKAFMAVVRDGGPHPEHQDDPDNLIDEAYEYFVRRTTEWLADSLGHDGLDPLVALRITLCDLLKMVCITLEQDDNAQVIFETLNARGTPLLALDLVKNAVFHAASHQQLDVDDLYETVWKPELDDDHWREEQRQGRLNRPRADLFLMHWLTMKLRRVTPATELFTTFRKQILQTIPPPDTAHVVRELCRDAGIMRGFESWPAGGDEALFFERLEALDVTTVLPLVLFLFREQSLPPDRRLRALKVLESWLVRRSLLRLTVKNYNLQIPVLIGRVAEDVAHADEILLKELREGVGEVSRWPTDSQLIDFYTSNDAYNNIARPRLVMALAAVERSLYGSKVDVPSIPTTLSLEHVIPQAWEEHWPLATDLSSDEEEAARETRMRCIHQLGNLTLTAGPLNTALSNSKWSAKQKELNRESKLLLNTRLVEGNPDCFDETAIVERTRDLVERICSIWPGPDHQWIPA